MFISGRQFFGFEGCSDNSGYCPVNCTHAWNYEQSLAQYAHQALLRPNGAMEFHTIVLPDKELWNHAPVADGQMGCVMKMYGEC